MLFKPKNGNKAMPTFFVITDSKGAFKGYREVGLTERVEDVPDEALTLHFLKSVFQHPPKRNNKLLYLGVNEP